MTKMFRSVVAVARWYLINVKGWSRDEVYDFESCILEHIG